MERLPTQSIVAAVSVSDKETNDDEIVVHASDFVVGCCTTNDDSGCEGSVEEPTLPTTDRAYEECVLLLIRQLRRDQSISSEAINSYDDWKELYVTAAKGIPELLTLQNSILQIQHALQLIQNEATTAIHDSTIADQNCQHWKHKYDAMEVSLMAIENENASLRQQNATLMSEKRKLKASVKKLLSQQQLVQTQQVESYVISALANHEQLLQHNHLGSSLCTNGTSKNRSRTTTLDTTVSTNGYDTLSHLDDPITARNSPNTYMIESSFSSNSTSQEILSSEVVNDTGNGCEVSPKLVKPISIPSNNSQLPAVVTTVTKEGQQPQKKAAMSKGMNGFMGNACQALGKKLLLIDSHHHMHSSSATSNMQQHTVTSSNTDKNVASSTIDNNINSLTNSETISPIPHTTGNVYSPIRFDIITPTLSEDSNDSVKMKKQQQHRQKNNFFHHQSPGMNSNKPLIDINTLYTDENSCLDAYGNVTNHHPDKANCYCNTSKSDQLLLSLPLLPNPSSLKSESPLSIPEEEESVIYDSFDQSKLSSSFIQVQRYSCDPSLLRSLSIPTMPIPTQKNY